MKKSGLLLKKICLLAATIWFCTTAGNVFAGSLSDAKQEKQELEHQLEETQELIDALSHSKEDVESNIVELDRELTKISERITVLEKKLTEKETELVNTQKNLDLAQKDVAQQYEDMKLRIRFMYENSMQSYLEILVSSNSIADILNRAEYIVQITGYDRKMLKKYEKTVEEITSLEANLEQERIELAELKKQVETEQEKVSVLLEAKEVQLAEIGENLSEAEKLAKIYEAEIQAQNKLIEMIRAEEARKKAEEEARKKAEEEAKKKAEEEKKTEETQQKTEAPQYNGGTFIWPCPSSTRVTSDYGTRTSPTGGASSNHKGIDIGAAFGADIVSVANGTVSFTGYNDAAGNYLTISHGDGVYTVYMHCSSIVVRSGEQVSAGQVVAKIGSTGISTGNHLHFGVSVNGNYVSPWNYLNMQ